MSRLSPLLFFILALFSAQVVFGAPSCSYSSNQTDNCISKCRHKFGLSSTPSSGLPTPAVDADPYNATTTTTSSTYSPTPSSDGDDDQPSSSSPSSTPTPTPSPTPSTSSSSSGDVSADDVQTYLDAHNSARAQYGADPLSWSDDLSALAQQWANGCVFQHSGGTLGPYGGKYLPSKLISWLLKVVTQKILPLVLVIIASQVLLMIGSRKLVSSMATKLCDAGQLTHSCAAQYDPNNPVASHFTQVVWKSTTTLGCAVATCNGIFPSSYGVSSEPYHSHPSLWGHANVESACTILCV